jgi:DNA-binding Lrp family transcriptional regulator
MSDIRLEILEILAQDARTTTAQMAVMLGLSQEQIEEEIQALEQEHVIVNWGAQINWEKTGSEKVDALIEVRITPQRDRGYSAIARRIYQFEEVTAVYLVSGGFDLMVMVTGTSMRQVAFFVAEKLSTLDGVLSAATHFVLKKYKVNGMMLDKEDLDDRLVIAP